MILDPFTSPVAIQLPQGAAMERVVAALAPEADRDRVLFAMSAATPKVVTDAVIGFCEVCAGEVWLAPSSIRAMAAKKHLVVCLPCFSAKWREMGCPR